MSGRNLFSKNLNTFKKHNTTLDTAIRTVQTNDELILAAKIEAINQAINTYSQQVSELLGVGNLELVNQKLLSEDYQDELNNGKTYITNAQSWIANQRNLEETQEQINAAQLAINTATQTIRNAITAESIKRLVTLQKFDAKLKAFQAQIECLSPNTDRYRDASAIEKADLDQAYSVGVQTWTNLQQYRNNYAVNVDTTQQEFTQQCLTELTHEKNKELNKPRGDWSIGRILGEFIRSLKSLVVENPTTPCFFKTTTQQKADALAEAVQELSSNGLRA